MRDQFAKLVGRNQHAFRKDYSTTTAQIQLQDSVTRAFDNSAVTNIGLLSLDFSKAFDKVGHQTILSKILLGGLPKGFVLWLKSYSEGRSFRIKI